jgi:hypothetical protein
MRVLQTSASSSFTSKKRPEHTRPEARGLTIQHSFPEGHERPGLGAMLGVRSGRVRIPSVTG